MFGDPDELQNRLGELAESMQGAQKVAWADNAIQLAVEMTVAAIGRIELDGTSDQQATQVRDAIRMIFPEAVTLVSEARQGLCLGLRPGARYPAAMCRNIRTLHNFEPPATEEEVDSAALQYVRKISGSTKPSQANQEAFDRAVAEVAEATRRLLDGLVTNAPPKDREVEAEKRRARAAAALRRGLTRPGGWLARTQEAQRPSWP